MGVTKFRAAYSLALSMSPRSTLALVSDQQGKLEKMLNEKQKQLEVITVTMRQKFVQQQIAAHEAATAQQHTAE